MSLITTAIIEDGTIHNCSIFDTQTGIRYEISIIRNVKYASPVRVEVISAHSSVTDNSCAAIVYAKNEAIDFWQGIIDTLGPGSTLADDALYQARKVINDKEFEKTLGDIKQNKQISKTADLPF